MAASQGDDVPTRGPSLTHLISSYAILPTLASWLSAVDLYHLALTNRSHYSYILSSPNIFKKLRRSCICDGRGLAKRQAFRAPYETNPTAGRLSINPQFDGDEEIEVRLYNVKCDEGGALPCIKCGINVCEECRYYPRAAPGRDCPNRRPHLSYDYSLNNIMCLCEHCDDKMEKELAGTHLNELCDCDLYKRWICTRCWQEDISFTDRYFENHTIGDWQEYFVVFPSKNMADHQHMRVFWCSCGAPVDQATRPRCTWCKRRHLPQREWYNEYKTIGSKLPFFDNNPDYPRWISNHNRRYPTPYPRLGYRRQGHGWVLPEGRAIEFQVDTR